jgi:deazaflavin-dependent oxidoreductase (nitroreductase family)
VRILFLIATTVHGGLYRISGGRIGARAAGLPVMLLTTTGRRSGKRRTVPLSFLEDGDAYVLIGSRGGSPQHPAWYLNLLVNPDVSVQIGRDHSGLRARRASPEEEERLWPKVLASSPGYGRYRAKTSREIPLVLLERG